MQKNAVVKVLVAEDEEFTRTLISDLLTNAGFEVKSVPSISAAISAMESFDPNVVITDLDFGIGPDGTDLIEVIIAERPWTGLIVLTAHASPELAVRDRSRIPDDAIYIVKSQITSTEQLYAAVEESILKSGTLIAPKFDATNKLIVSASQGEILRLMAEGLSNAAIAKERGITLRAAEALIQRTLISLDVKSDPNINARVVAVRLWQQGKVVVK